MNTATIYREAPELIMSTEHLVYVDGIGIEYLRVNAIDQTRIEDYVHRLGFWNCRLIDVAYPTNYIFDLQMPSNIALDARYVFMLYQKFGDSSDQFPFVSAVCGFGIKKIEVEATGESAIGLIIQQIQTANFESERDMIRELGYFNYQKFFIDQLSKIALNVREVWGLSTYFGIELQQEYDDKRREMIGDRLLTRSKNFIVDLLPKKIKATSFNRNATMPRGACIVSEV